MMCGMSDVWVCWNDPPAMLSRSLYYTHKNLLIMPPTSSEIG